MKVVFINNLNDFIDAVFVLSESKSDWEVKDFMNRINNIIVNSIKSGQQVSIDVMIAYFNLYALLGNKASRHRIRASAEGVKSWIQEKQTNSYGTGSSQQRELLEDK